jgi:hypothetical protein
MDDTAQKQKLASDNAPVQAQPSVPVQPQVQPQPQVAPTGTANKEVEVAPVSDFVKPSEPEPIKDREVAEAGIVEAEKQIKLEEAHEQMEVSLAAESTPVKTEPTSVVQLPSEQEAKKIVRKGPRNFNLEKFFSGVFFADSIYGFAILMLKHLKRIHKKLVGQPA